MVELATSLALATLCASLVIIMVRLVRGPSLEDRVVALDLMATTVVGLAVVLAVHQGTDELVDFAIVFALVAFVGTVAFAAYLERGEQK